MRWCTPQGALDLECKVAPSAKPKNLIPWFEFERTMPLPKIVFGHWAALMGKTGNEKIVGVDTGCVWRNYLTAYRLEDGYLQRVKAGTKRH